MPQSEYDRNQFLEAQKKKEEEHSSNLWASVRAASPVADWIYHDERLDCDGESETRTRERLREIDSTHGREALFGLAGWWVAKSYSRLALAHRSKGFPPKPSLLPRAVDDLLHGEDTSNRSRAWASAQQFTSTLTHDNILTAEAIFNAAYDSGVEDWIVFMYTVLLLSIRISNTALRISVS